MFEKLPVKTIDGKRHYVAPSGNAYPSVTSVIGTLTNPKLEEWKKDVGEDVAEYVKIQAGIIGTQFHKICEDFLRIYAEHGHLSTVEGILKDKYPRLFPWAHFQNIKYDLLNISNIKAQEATLWSDTLKLAGTTDCVGIYQTKDTFEQYEGIIDFKTASKLKDESDILNYFLQTTAYSIMWEERTGQSLKYIIIIMSGADGK